MKKIHIKNTLGSRAYEFLTKKKFTDCILKDGDNTLHAHRLILSQRSRWFNNYFKEHAQDTGECQVLLPFNDQNVIKILIEFMYSRVITVNFQNIMAIIKASDVYGIEDLKKQAISFIKKEMPSQPDIIFLKIAKEFVNLGLTNIFIEQNECITRLGYLLCTVDTTQRKNQIFDSISPLILAKILKICHFNNSDKKMDKLSTIDSFCNFYISKKLEQHKEEANARNINSILTQDEKLALENVFTWEQNDYKRFLSYNCDWVSDSTSRKCINSIIDNRRNIISNFEKEIQTSNSSNNDICQWYPFVWTSAIANSNIAEKSPEVNIISFLNTFDKFIDNKNAINPGKYKLVRIESTPAMDKTFDPTNAVWLDKSRYYLSTISMSEASINDQQPFYSINFGENARFEISEIVLESDIQRSKKGKRQFPDSVKIEGMKCDNQIVEPVYQKVVYDADGKCTTKLHFDSPISQIKITMVGEERNGGNLLRIKFIDAKGHFIQ